MCSAATCRQAQETAEPRKLAPFPNAATDILSAHLRTFPTGCYKMVMSVKGSCHCGSVRLEVPASPEWVADCNCSLCRLLVWRVAYYPPDDVCIVGETTAYVWGDRMIGIHHCPVCGCGTHWQSLGENFDKMGINARLLDNFDENVVEVRKIDNAG